jgi:hypothetical protein
MIRPMPEPGSPESTTPSSAPDRRAEVQHQILEAGGKDNGANVAATFHQGNGGHVNTTRLAIEPVTRRFLFPGFARQPLGESPGIGHTPIAKNGAVRTQENHAVQPMGQVQIRPEGAKYLGQAGLVALGQGLPHSGQVRYESTQGLKARGLLLETGAPAGRPIAPDAGIGPSAGVHRVRSKPSQVKAAVMTTREIAANRRTFSLTLRNTDRFFVLANTWPIR